MSVKFRLSAAPQELLSGALFNAAWLCGIGFTMSLFIAMLAFDETGRVNAAKSGILAGSLLAGAWRRRRTLVLTASVTAVACGISTIVALLYSDGFLVRFGIQEAIGFRLVLVMLAGVLVDTLLERRRELHSRQSTPSAGEGQEGEITQLLAPAGQSRSSTTP